MTRKPRFRTFPTEWLRDNEMLYLGSTDGDWEVVADNLTGTYRWGTVKEIVLRDVVLNEFWRTTCVLTHDGGVDWDSFDKPWYEVTPQPIVRVEWVDRPDPTPVAGE